jgi:hypothetical protein
MTLRDTIDIELTSSPDMRVLRFYHCRVCDRKGPPSADDYAVRLAAQIHKHLGCEAVSARNGATMIDSRFSIFIQLEFDGSWTAHITDYGVKPTRSVKSMLFKTQRAAQAEADQIVRSWKWESSTLVNSAHGGAA